MIQCKELNTSFDSDEQLFKALKENKNFIIDQKKAEIIKSYERDMSIVSRPLDPLKLSTQEKNISVDDNYYYIAVNSTNILDSHKDLHVEGIWNKTVKEQKGKNYLVDTHVLSINTTIARKEHIEMFTAKIPFSMIGKKYDGETEVLIYKVAKDKILSKIAKDWLDSGDDIEASVRMQYVKLSLAMNSDNKEDKEEKKTYDKYFNKIANKDDFDDVKYFWVISEAKNINESSLVPFGSNGSTGQVKNNIEPQNKSTQEIEPSIDTHKEASTIDANKFNELLMSKKI